MRSRPVMFLMMLLLGLCTACQRSTFLVLSIERGAETPPTVARLEVALTLNGRALPLQTITSQPIALPTSVALQLGLEQGELQVAVRVFDPQGAEVDRGNGMTTLRRSENNALTVRLTEGRALPLLRADREALDLGTVVLGASAMPPTGTFEIRNDGRAASGALETALTGQENFALVGDLCQGKSLQVGDRCTVTVAFNPGSTGAQTGSLQIKAQSILTLKLSGTAVTPGALLVTPDARNFMGVVLGTSQDASFVVRNSGGSATGKLALSLGGPAAADFEISQRTCEGTKLDPQGECPLSVRFRPGTGGSKTATLSIKADPGGTAVLTLGGTGLRPAALALSANQLDLGAVVVNNSSAEGVIVVRNSGDLNTGPLDVTLTGAEFKLTGNANTCKGQSLASGASCEVRVTLAPMSLGAKLGAVQISGPAPLAAVSVQLGGSGIAPAQISLSPSVLDFGTVAVGSSAGLMVTVTNNGGATTGALAGVINTMAPMGGLTVDMAGCGSLAMGASCTAKVTFQPTSYGQQRGDLAVSASPGGMTAASVTGVGRDSVPVAVVVQGTGSGSVVLPAAGSVSGMAVTCTTGSCTQSYYRTLAAPQVTLTATPSASSSFFGWGGSCTGAATTCSLTLSTNQQVVATFLLQQFQLSVAKGGVGTGTVTSNDGRIACGATCQYDRYDFGTQVTLTATPAAGYYFGGWSGVNCGMEPVCQVSMTAARNVTASFTYANYMFVTSRGYSIQTLQNMGTGADPAARVLSGADKACNTAASTIGLRGTYVAWLSSQAQNAVSRIPTTARGWIRTDGKPITDTLGDFLSKPQVFYPPELDEKSAGGFELIITATYGDGTFVGSGGSCQNWSQTTGAGSLLGGVRHGGSWGWTYAGYQWNFCSFDYQFYCMGVDYTALVRPPPRPAQGRFAFVSRARFNASTGLRGADQICNDEASAAGLPNRVYLALLASSTASALSRFTLTGAPVYRPDGVMALARDTDLATTGRLLAPIVISAFGDNQRQYDVWSGADSPNVVGTSTCKNWTSGTSADAGRVGLQDWSSVNFFSHHDDGCNALLPVYCMSL